MRPPLAETRYSRPGMLRPLRERIGPEQPNTTLPSWGSTWDLINLSFHNRPEIRKLARANRGVVKAYFDAESACAQGDDTKLQAFIIERVMDPTSPNFNRELVKELDPVLQTVKSRFPQKFPQG